MKHARRQLEIPLTADELIARVLAAAGGGPVCLLDSCGAPHLGSRYLIAGLAPRETLAVTRDDPAETLALVDAKLAAGAPAVFTISYEFGLKLERIAPRQKECAAPPEPDVFLALFDYLYVHDYETGETHLVGDPGRFAEAARLIETATTGRPADAGAPPPVAVRSNFTRAEYLAKIAEIKERIRRGDTYQTNLTQQFTAELGAGGDAAAIFRRLRLAHPAPFAALIERGDSAVVSGSPERFVKIARRMRGGPLVIETPPTKGTRPRGATPAADARLRRALAASEKDRAENVMIVDLLRNDLGRICEFGTVRVEKLCDLETHPTLFHLVSTVAGELRAGARFSDVLRAVFPCGSITGAPKISTMRIIDELETAPRGLSMGAIGFFCPDAFEAGAPPALPLFDLAVAIRTMTVRDGRALFNVGGGIVIDSDPAAEYDETLTKARALFAALNGRLA